jgi:hypothetical protein
VQKSARESLECSRIPEKNNVSLQLQPGSHHRSLSDHSLDVFIQIYSRPFAGNCIIPAASTHRRYTEANATQ